MCRLEKIINGVYITGGLVILMVVVMSMTSCGIKKCCEKTIEEVYKYEGEYINENK